ncbi:multidrug effflux MFS transporter [Scrofimicrobium sp. R131]|uniref:Multidrug effflux MFS transporter n=1 Tax=Scrofimicrobium appendicitidis TaxID=3079930 RepID=A0AAU7V6W7_9ACTO
MSNPPSGAGVNPGDELSRRQRLTYVVVLGMLTALGPFTVDMYLPAFPAIQHQFGVDPAAVQLTLTGTMVGFAAGQLIVGPLSDKVGRKVPLIVAALVHIAASIGVAMAPDIIWLGVLRVIQGFGAASSGVVSMAMVRDLFGGRRLVKMLSRLALVNGLAPVIAPVLGSQLLAIMSWRGIFWVLAGYGILVSIALVVLIAETHPPARRLALQKPLRERYRAVLSDRIYVGSLVVTAMNFTALFAYLSSSPFLFQQVYGMNPQQYGILFAINSVGVIVGVQTSAHMMHLGRWSPQWIIATALAGQIVLGAVIFGLSLAGAGLWGTIIPLWFFIFCCALNFPAIQFLALANHGEEAGTAASLLGAVNFGVAGILSPIIGVLGVGSAEPMAGMMVVAALLGTAALWLIIRPRTVPDLD